MKKLKSLLWGLFALAISGLFGWMLHSEVKELYELSIYGVETTGIVIDYKYKERTGRKGRVKREYNHLIKYDNNNKWVNLHQQFPINSRFNVLYLTYDTNIIRVTQETELWPMLKDELGWFGLLFLPGVFLVFGLAGLLHLKNALFVASDKINI